MEMHIDLGMIKVFLCLRYRVLNNNLRLFRPLDASPQLCAAVVRYNNRLSPPQVCVELIHARSRRDMEQIWNNEMEGMKKEMKEMSERINEIDSIFKIHFTKN